MPPDAGLILNMPVAEALRRLLLVQLGEIQHQSQAILDAGDNPAADAVHDLRVAIRRSLAVLAGFAPWLDPDWTRQAGKAYREILEPTGRLRDLDVLAEWATALPPATLAADSGFLRRLEQDRRAERRRLGEFLCSKTFRKWAAQWRVRLNRPDSVLDMSLPAISERGKVRLYRLQECLPVLLYSAAADMTVYRAVIPGPETPDAADNQSLAPDILHRLRVTAKNFRYLAEACQPVLNGGATRQLIQDFRRFQDLLGNWHDAVIGLRHLDRFLTGKEGDPIDDLRRDWVNRMAEKQTAFLQLWPTMTPDWFHERIAACLDRQPAQKD